jgi:hypothetical protein
MLKSVISKFDKPIVFILDFSGIVIMLGAVSLDLIQNANHFAIGISQIILAFIGAGLTLISNLTLSPQTSWRSKLLAKSPSLVVFTISMLLLLINLVGVLVPLRNPAVDEGISFGGKVRQPQYSADQVYEQMNRIADIDEQYPEYVKRLTQLIFDGTVHYWEENEAGNPFNLRVPLRENFILYFTHLLRGDRANYEFCRAERAIERAASVCSQSSKILADILGRNRVKAHIVGLEGHVVVRARVDNEADTWWVLDADYGVVIERDIDEIEADLDFVREAYLRQGYSESVVDTLVEIYGPEDNQIIDENLECEQEDHLYLLKWLLPILGLIPFPVFLLVNRLRKQIL